jgi:two-component system, NarL family, nitrate/nitrite response regulator NarL
MGASSKAGPVVALIALRPQARASLAASMQRAIPGCEVRFWRNRQEIDAQGEPRAPALAVLDADMLGSELAAALADAQRRFPACRLVVIATPLEDAQVQAAVMAGAMTYLPKRYSTSQRELVLQLAWEGIGHLPRFVPLGATRNAGANGQGSNAQLPLPASRGDARALTPKQVEVLSYLAEGRSNRYIGEQLRIREGTVKLHVTEILRKLEVDTRGQAMLLARRLEQVQRLVLQHGEDGSLVLDGLMSLAIHRHYRSGEIIFHRGDPGGELFYVQRGMVQLDEIGEEMGPGDIFGEIGVFSPERARTSTARCRTDVDVFCLEAEDARRMYFEYPHFALRIATLLAQRLVAERAGSGTARSARSGSSGNTRADASAPRIRTS